MTQQMPVGAQAPAQPNMNDPLMRLLADMQRDQQRLRAMAEPTPNKLAIEINDTLLPYLIEVTQVAVGLRNELARLHGWLNQIVPDLGARLDELENSEPPGLDEEQVVLFADIVAACRSFIALALDQNPNDEVKAEMATLQAKCDAAQAVLEDIAEDDGDEGAEGEDGSAPHALMPAQS